MDRFEWEQLPLVGSLPGPTAGNQRAESSHGPGPAIEKKQTGHAKTPKQLRFPVLKMFSESFFWESKHVDVKHGLSTIQL